MPAVSCEAVTSAGKQVSRDTFCCDACQDKQNKTSKNMTVDAAGTHCQLTRQGCQAGSCDVSDCNTQRIFRAHSQRGGVQVVLVSATLPVEVLDMTSKFMNEPLKVMVKRDELTLEVRLCLRRLAWSEGSAPAACHLGDICMRLGDGQHPGIFCAVLSTPWPACHRQA